MDLGDTEREKRLNELKHDLANKRYQEDECVLDLQRHTGRDVRIRQTLKALCDHFREKENEFRSLKETSQDFNGCRWKAYIDRGSIKHQDDMTKVDLLHLIVTASADIAIWRYDVNANVNAVTNDAVDFSHEQGMRAKNAALTAEDILLEHILRCSGESVKIFVSDNASVDKHWVTTVALPQYMVEQGLAEIVVVAFLENNHGKWLADMMFGQFRTRRRRQTLLSIDDMLAGFERIKKKCGKIHGFALNPLISVKLEEIFWSLGYEVTPPKDFRFVKRNIHLAAARATYVKSKLSTNMKDLFVTLLPDEPGMVRISSEPPNDLTNSQLPFQARYFDIPAVRQSFLDRPELHATGPSILDPAVCNLLDEDSVPLVVTMDKAFERSGNGVVSARTMDKVGYNGIKFRKLKACPEINRINSRLVRRAWPRSLADATNEDESVASVEEAKFAPLNWVMRKPVSHFCNNELDWKARYPPMNMLNAQSNRGPRESSQWIPTATYEEQPVPTFERTSVFTVLQRLAAEHSDLSLPIGKAFA